MSKFIFPLLVVATMFVADYAFGAGTPHVSQSATPTESQSSSDVRPRGSQ